MFINTTSLPPPSLLPLSLLSLLPLPLPHSSPTPTQCVKLSKFESERSISFIPPDGEFELMRSEVVISSNVVMTSVVHVLQQSVLCLGGIIASVNL